MIRKILFTVIASLLFVYCNSQTVRTRPVGWQFQQWGNATTWSQFNGVAYPVVGFALPLYVDTLTANSTDVDLIPLTIIATSGDGKVWRRNAAATKWEEFLIAGSAGIGTVTSVGLSMPSIFNVSGSPVTTSGTLTATLATQSANTVFAGPTSGGAATPTFRSLVTADLPAGTGTVTSVGLSMPSAFNVANSPVTSSGTLTVTGAGTTSQYIRGDGSLATYTGGVMTLTNGLTLTGTIGTLGGRLDGNTSISGRSNYQLLMDSVLFIVRGVLGNGAAPSNYTEAQMMFHPRVAAFRAGLASGTQWNAANMGGMSVGTGQNTLASGFISTAMGNNTQATADVTFARGQSTQANGGTSEAGGYESIATGIISYAHGYGSAARDSVSVAHGTSAIANQKNQTVFGKFNDTTHTTAVLQVGWGTQLTRANVFEAMSDNSIRSGYLKNAGNFTFLFPPETSNDTVATRAFARSLGGGGGGVTGSGTAEQIAIWTGATAIGGDANLTYDATEGLGIVGNNTGQPRFVTITQLANAINGASILGRHQRLTGGLIAGDAIFSLAGAGYDGSTYEDHEGVISLKAINTFSGTSRGGRWTFEVSDSTAGAAVTEIMTVYGGGSSVSGGGGVGIGVTIPTARLDVFGGAIYQRPSASAGTTMYMRTNGQNTTSTTTLNAGILFSTVSNYYFGADLGFDATVNDFGTRLFSPTNIYFSNSLNGATDQAHFTTVMYINTINGRVGIGTVAPTAMLHLKAGTATASTGPLKFTSGTNMTTPEAGAMEYDGTNFYLTNSTASRRTIVMDGFGAATAAANDLTLPKSGNKFHITGATQINAITTSGWPTGITITLIFDSNPTVKNNTAGGAGTAVILLAGGADFSATANDVLVLLWDGTSFFEQSRSVN